MRSILLSFSLAAIIGTLNAQVPLGFSFQTIIRDSEGKVQKNQSVSLRFSILEGSESGSSIYSETHSKTTNEFGVINLTIGTGTPLSGSFSSIVWGSNIHFLKTEIDPMGGSSYSISTTSQLMSVPYAMHATQADTAFKTNVPSGITNGDILYWDGTNWAKLQNGNPGNILRVNSNNEPYWANQQTLDLPEYIPADGLVGYWPFNGNANDESGNGNHGTINGAILSEDRFMKSNNAYSFNSSNIIINNISNSFFLNNFSISGWVYLDSLSASVPYPTFLTQENHYLVLQNEIQPLGIAPRLNSYFLNFYQIEGQQVEDGHVQGKSTFNSWNHFLLNNINKINYLYINGNLTDISDFPSSIQGAGSGNYIKLGNFSSDMLNVEKFIGKLDDIIIYKRALSEQEIQNLYNQSSPFIHDIDGNAYETVKIGSQEWMAENLRTTHYNDGTSILKIIDKTTWANNNNPAFSFYNNDSSTYVPTYCNLPQKQLHLKV